MNNQGAPTWGAGVRTLRGIRDLTQVELAALAGVSQPVISRIENGSREVSDAVRIRIAKALDFDPHALFPYEEQAS